MNTTPPSPWSLGIDFGTSNTAAAHTGAVKGTVEAINLTHGHNTMPSSVYMETPDHVDTGDVAIAKAEANPTGFIPAPKRLIPQQHFQLGGLEVPSAVPVAAVLHSVLGKAVREHGGQQPAQLVLTHPEAWSDAEIRVLLDAASGLGLGPDAITTVSEPQAAAHYYSAARALEAGEKIAVFDFGGGTLDVAVLQAQDDGTFTVIAARGSNAIGGKTFDALMRKWVDTQLEDNNPELLDYLRKKATLAERYALEDSIRRAKELLSEAASATINVVTDSHDTERLQITRGEFEELIAPVLTQATNLTRATLADAGISTPDELVALYLTGGSSRIPIVQEYVKDLGPVATLDDPKTVVAQGALAATSTLARKLGGQAPQPNQAPHPDQAPRPDTPHPTTAAEQTHVLPTVGENTPTQAPDEKPRPAATTTARGGKKIKVLGAVAAAAVVLGVGAVMLLNQPDSQQPSVVATGTTPSTDTAPAGEAAPAGDAAPRTTVNANAPQADPLAAEKQKYLDALPAGFPVNVDSCSYTETLKIGQVFCQVNDSAEANKVHDFVHVRFNLKTEDSAVRDAAKRARECAPYGSDADPHPVDTGNPNAFACAYREPDASEIAIANIDDGYAIKLSGFDSPDSAEKFARTYGLL